MPEAGAAPSIADRLARLIEADGPIPVSHYMGEANAHYYASRDPFGSEGDFITAPEISQMFGELIGLWCADLWIRSGRPAGVRYVELGPGRGTLAADALRAMRKAGFAPQVDLVETSPVLRAAQRQRLPDARWHDHPADLPDDAPLIVVANEFFDALPVRQLIATDTGWRERMVDFRGGRFAPIAGAPAGAAAIPAAVRDAPPGTIVETSPAAVAIVEDLAVRIAAQGGAALIVDYGHDRTGVGDTLQAVRGHRFADPWQEPGESDLTAHVDFAALAAAAQARGVRVHGPVGQGEWLERIGIGERARTLADAAPARAAEIAAAHRRLTAEEEMGSLFKVMAFVSADWAAPAGL